MFYNLYTQCFGWNVKCFYLLLLMIIWWYVWVLSLTVLERVVKSQNFISLVVSSQNLGFNSNFWFKLLILKNWTYLQYGSIVSIVFLKNFLSQLSNFVHFFKNVHKFLLPVATFWTPCFSFFPTLLQNLCFGFVLWKSLSLVVCYVFQSLCFQKSH